jgi:hypothetical protein
MTNQINGLRTFVAGRFCLVRKKYGKVLRTAGREGHSGKALAPWNGIELEDLCTPTAGICE